MIKLIATIDSVRGISIDNGTSWGLNSVNSHTKEKIKSAGYVSNSDLFDELIDEANELYIIQVCKDFRAEKKFPPFEKDFKLTKKSGIKKENGIEYQFQVWRKK